MTAYKAEAIVHEDHTIQIDNLPFQTGTEVEVIVIERETRALPTFPLRGTQGTYSDPAQPVVADDEWEALK